MADKYWIVNSGDALCDINLSDGTRQVLRPHTKAPILHVVDDSDKKYYAGMADIGIKLVVEEEKKEDEDEEPEVQPQKMMRRAALVTESTESESGEESTESESGEESTESESGEESTESESGEEYTFDSLMKLRAAELKEIAVGMGIEGVEGLAKKDISNKILERQNGE